MNEDQVVNISEVNSWISSRIQLRYRAENLSVLPIVLSELPKLRSKRSKSYEFDTYASLVHQCEVARHTLQNINLSGSSSGSTYEKQYRELSGRIWIEKWPKDWPVVERLRLCVLAADLFQSILRIGWLSKRTLSPPFCIHISFLFVFEYWDVSFSEVDTIYVKRAQSIVLTLGIFF